MQKELRDLFRTIWKGSNLIHITNDDLEAFVGRGTTTLMADFQTEYNRQGAFKVLCNCVQQKLMAGRGRGHADRLLIYIDMPDGEQGLTIHDLEDLRNMQAVIAPAARQVFAMGTHAASYLRMAVVMGMDIQQKAATLFHFKEHNIFAFSDTHGLHRQMTIPPQADILVCAGDAVEDNLDPADYHDFITWYRSQPARLRLFTPGNHELMFDIAPLWAETLFATDEIVLLRDGVFTYDGIHFASITDDTACHPDVLPEHVDILITHYPPHGLLDSGIGSVYIRQAAEVMKPQYHIFGHVHSEGMKVASEGLTQYINVSYHNLLYGGTTNEGIRE